MVLQHAGPAQLFSARGTGPGRYKHYYMRGDFKSGPTGQCVRIERQWTAAMADKQCEDVLLRSQARQEPKGLLYPLPDNNM
jgi:hypothetical protein